MIGEECSVLPIPPTEKSHTLLCTDLVGGLAEDCVLQIMSDSPAKNLPVTDLGALSLLRDKKENVSDIDFSFLNEGIIPETKQLNEESVVAKELMMSSNFQESSEIEGNAVEGDMVMIDTTKPIQLLQNSLIMVNGQKCVLQQDSRTGQVVAYPIKEQITHRKRRGRPRKTSVESMFKSFEKAPPQETESFSEEETEKGLLEVLNDDGSLVRRSSRKRKKAKVLKDYETGNLQQELGSDVDEVEDADTESSGRRRKSKGPGRPRKLTHSFENISQHSTSKESDVRRSRGRPRKDDASEATQAFLVQTADGQTLMLQVPLSSIPQGTTLQEMAQDIANKLNGGFVQTNTAILSTTEKSCVESESLLEPALQDHSIGSTTNFSTLQPEQLESSQVVMDIIGEEICEPQEITLECNQSLNDVTSAAHLGEVHPLNTSESLEDHFCLDVSSTTAVDSGAVPALCPFDESLIDHSFYGVRQDPTKTTEESTTPIQRTVVSASDNPTEVELQLFQGGSEMVEESIIAIDSKLNNSSDPKDLFPAASEIKNVMCETVLMEDASNSIHVEDASKALPGKAEVLAVLLQESLTEDSSTFSVPEKLTEALSGPKKCKICAMPYCTEEEIVEHFKAKHPKCICLECHYMNEHPYGIKRHAFRHLNEHCVCNICHKKYKDSYILKMHVKMVHMPPEVLFRCEVCSKEFTRKAHLKRHQRIHAPVKQYRCPLCNYHGCEKSDVTKHLLIHEEPKFKCEFCGKTFRHLKNKELHVKRHSGQRDYKCAFCHFYGYTYTDIRKHIERRHSSTCPRCKGIFSNPELCKEHERSGVCLLQGEDAKMADPPTLDDKKEEIPLLVEIHLDI